MKMSINIRPATWESFQQVMGENGGCGGCWCMLWRLSRKQMDAQMGKQNKLAMKSVFGNSRSPGLVAFDGNNAIGWIQFAPRCEFPRLETSRILKPVDDNEVWSVSCFLVHKTYRNQGLSLSLLSSACKHAEKHGARILEGYPVEPRKMPYPPVYAWVGFASVFRKAGFKEVARRSETRPIMRKILKKN